MDKQCLSILKELMITSYRRIYFEALDLVTTAINDRFNQPDYGVYAECEELLLSAVNAITLKQ